MIQRPVNKDQLTARSWELLQEAVESGKLRLEDGTVVELNPGILMKAIQWLASLDSVRKRKDLGAPEEFRVRG